VHSVSVPCILVILILCVEECPGIAWLLVDISARNFEFRFEFKRNRYMMLFLQQIKLLPEIVNTLLHLDMHIILLLKFSLPLLYKCYVQIMFWKKMFADLRQLLASKASIFRPFLLE
jgi:hypothetical protein